MILPFLLVVVMTTTLVMSKQQLTLSGNYGYTCNQLHSLSYALELSKEKNAILVLWGTWTTLVNEHLDVEHLHHHYDIELQSDMPMNVEVIPSSGAFFIGLRHNLAATRLHLRPRPEYRRRAEEIIRAHHMIRPIIGIHLRYFLDPGGEKCKDGMLIHPEWIEQGRPCHISVANYPVDPNAVCNTQLDTNLMNRMTTEWPELESPFSFYVATDGQRPDLVDSFFRSSLRSVRSILGTENLFVDMWSSVLCDYYVPNLMSSCEPIITQWRSVFWKGYPVRVSPRACFEPFANESLSMF
jgi:hypothetical protein